MLRCPGCRFGPNGRRRVRAGQPAEQAARARVRRWGRLLLVNGEAGAAARASGLRGGAEVAVPGSIVSNRYRDVSGAIYPGTERGGGIVAGVRAGWLLCGATGSGRIPDRDESRWIFGEPRTRKAGGQHREITSERRLRRSHGTSGFAGSSRRGGGGTTSARPSGLGRSPARRRTNGAVEHCGEAGRGLG